VSATAAQAPALEGSLLRGSTLTAWCARHGEPIVFWAVALLYLIPVWSFRYVPTQDGPSHLYNAQLLKDYHDPAAGYAAFYELRGDPLPNLTSHVVLAALMYVLPPLGAEKVLVSLYLLGFAGGYRYFLGAFGPRCRALAWAGLLFAFQRCFWLGFYNFCLSLVPFWLLLGYVVRRRGTLQFSDVPVLLVLLTAAYFTHLAGYLLAVVGALAAVLLVPPRQALAPVLIVIAALPSACLTLDYFEQTGFFKATSALRLFHQPLDILSGNSRTIDLEAELSALDSELLGCHAGSASPLGLLVACYLALLTALTLAEGRREDGAPGPLFPAVFGLCLLVAFVVVPNHLGSGHGGYVKARLAPLPPLLWLACLHEPAQRHARLLVRAVTPLLLVVNLVLITRTVQLGNEKLDQYTAGVAAVGAGHRLFVQQQETTPPPLADPLLHASHYYCLDTGNVNLDNYEAGTPHFPVKYRSGVRRGKGSLFGHPQQDAVDTLLCWTPRQVNDQHPAGWLELFHAGPLRIYRRPPQP
jgi:hypothetical protein